MCGIVGAVAQRDIAEILLEGLRRLEYRGYDSAGLAVVDNEGHMTRVRRLGKVQMLAQAVEEQPLHGGTGIAHTRWATHGEPSESNAHPHVSEHIAVVHNGIIENHEPLRALLQSRGYVFVSETDTEVIAHLVHWELEQGGTLREAVLRAIPQLRGAYGTVIMDTRDPGTLLAARSGSPLVIGLGMGENFIASDQLALLPVTRRFIFLEEGDIAEVTRRTVVIFDKSGAEVNRQEIESNLQYDAGDKGIYRHYMQKEIYEQPNAIKNTLTGRISHGEVDLSDLGPNANALLSQDKRIEQLAERFSDKHHALFLGRGDQYPIALEGALKLKEISYIHAEAYAAGELKHGPLALIDAEMPVIVVAPNNELLEKLKSNIEEVRARGGELYVFADGDAGFSGSDNMHIIEMPHVEEVIAPIFYTVPLQLLAYHVALIKGTDVDQPRNLAKSVTVE